MAALRVSDASEVLADDLHPLRSKARYVGRKRADREGPIHLACLHYLRTTLPHGWIVQHSANKPRNSVQGGREKAMGVIAGWPDLAIYGPGPDGPSVWFVEVKEPRGVVSPAQRVVHDRLMDAGLSVRVVRSVDDLRAAVEDWQLPSKDALIKRRPL